ncbi:YCII-related protein [Paraburkholderia ribeironis]|uniref:YCII-related protein n=1 Tax=Paraburkholderia ribeironis TaxID=1247936 RepID=A0A1N7RM25_9BURK|nr:YciI family protein [Paraburkholderia ribeironis]SIT36165.1 YCII-related protein [Paraburkholderia ribeironis]
MNFSMLVYEGPAAFALRSEQDAAMREAYMSAWSRYTKALRDAGVLVTGSGLQLPDTATTLTLQENGKRRVQDGPYADTKEQLGGFYIINVPDLDTALDWASRIPAAPASVIEVRQCLMPPAPA